jgi:hypothetical protein
LVPELQADEEPKKTAKDELIHLTATSALDCAEFGHAHLVPQLPTVGEPCLKPVVRSHSTPALQDHWDLEQVQLLAPLVLVRDWTDWDLRLP